MERLAWPETLRPLFGKVIFFASPPIYPRNFFCHLATDRAKMREPCFPRFLSAVPPSFEEKDPLNSTGTGQKEGGEED